MNVERALPADFAHFQHLCWAKTSIFSLTGANWSFYSFMTVNVWRRFPYLKFAQVFYSLSILYLQHELFKQGGVTPFSPPSAALMAPQMTSQPRHSMLWCATGAGVSCTPLECKPTSQIGADMVDKSPLFCHQVPEERLSPRTDPEGKDSISIL